jgi:hypothetical protein
MTYLPIDTSLAIYILLGCIAMLTIWIIILNSRLKKFLHGVGAQNMGDSLVFFKKELNAHNQFIDTTNARLKDIDTRLARSIQSVETVRFNPFKGTGLGGAQSFATVFLNENGDGLVLSSLSARDRLSVFSKPIASFKPQFELSEEESQILSVSRKNLGK